MEEKLSEYEKLKSRIESKAFESTRDARHEISKLLVKNQIGNAEHAELRSLLNETYKD